MTEKNSTTIRNSIIVTLSTGAIHALVTYLIPGGWGSVFTVIKAVLMWLGSTSATYNWLLCILIPCSVMLLGWTVMALFANLRSSDNLSSLPKQMTFLGVVFRWTYLKNGHVNSFASFCPMCDFQIYPQPSSTYKALPGGVYFCENCSWQSQPFDCTIPQIENQVLRKIDHCLREHERQQNDDHRKLT